VRYEELCREPRATLRAVLDHCRLAAADDALAQLAGQLHAPAYSQPRFTPDELAIIDRHTGAAAERLGYAPPVAAGLSAEA
jgi:hypothetical protein